MFEDLTPEQDQIVTQLIYNCILLNDFLMSVIAEMRTPLEHSSLCKGHIKQEYQRLMKAEDSYRGRIKNALQDMDNKYFFCDVADAWIGKLGKRPEYLLGAIRNGLRDAGVPQYDVRAHVFRVSLISQMAYGQYLINMQDIGKVKVGAEARVKLTAYPFQRHGTLTGVVKNISEDTLDRQVGGMQVKYYRARLTVSGRLRPVKNDLRLRNFRLIPGMETQCEIKCGRRRVIEYVLYPLIKAMDETAREP